MLAASFFGRSTGKLHCLAMGRVQGLEPKDAHKVWETRSLGKKDDAAVRLLLTVCIQGAQREYFVFASVLCSYVSA